MTHIREVQERAKRSKLLRAARVHVRGSEHSAILRDISSGGALVQVKVEFAPAERVVLELSDRQRLTGTVRWMDGDKIGIAFERALVMDGLEAVVAAVREEKPQSHVPWNSYDGGPGRDIERIRLATVSGRAASPAPHEGERNPRLRDS